MRQRNTTIAVIAALTLGGCATAKFGDKTVEAQLKKFEPKADQVSLYVCREDSFSAGGVGAEAFVNGRAVGALKPNTFAHTEVRAGDIQVFLRRNGIGVNSGDSGVLKLQAKAGDVLVVWAGATPFGPLTVDSFTTAADGKACVTKASYAIP